MLCFDGRTALNLVAGVDMIAPDRAIFVAILFAAAIPSAQAETASVVSKEIQVKDTSGNTIDGVSFDVGSTLELTPLSAGRFGLSLNGETAILDSAGLAFREEEGGCFRMEAEAALSAESDDLWQDRDIRGRGRPYGESLDIKLTASSSISAGVEVCIVFDKPLVFEPMFEEMLRYQSMVVRQFWKPDINADGAVPRVKVSSSVEAGATLEATLEAYCLDSERETPDEEVQYQLVKFDGDKNLELALSNPNDLSPRALVRCIWAARAFSDNFAHDIVSYYLDIYHQKQQLDKESISRIHAYLIYEHRSVLARCHNFVRMSECDTQCQEAVMQSEPWSVADVGMMVRTIQEKSRR